MQIRSEALLHASNIRRVAHPEKMTFLQRKTIGDVAYINIEDAVAVDISEVYSHSLERILSKHERGRRCEAPLPFENREFEVPRSRSVVEQPVRAEIIGNIYFRQQVAIEIRSARG